MSERQGFDLSGLSRRDFLKIAGITAGAGLVEGIGLYEYKKNPDIFHKKPLELTPEIVSGVEVYGLKEKITSADMVDKLYAYFDEKFANENGINITNKVEQRKELLNPNERYLEVSVRRSAYDSFTEKQNATGMSFPEWIKIHVDIMNRILKSAEPALDIKVVLRRIIVMEDKAAGEFWDESRFRDGAAIGSAFDVAWKDRFYPFCIDTDHSWAIADDYRGSGGAYFWEFHHECNKTIFGTPVGKFPYIVIKELPDENDSLSGKNYVSFDMGLIHEWSHYVLNLPDEYTMDVHDPAVRFKDFTLGSSNFSVPEMSPYLTYLMKENIGTRSRDHYVADRWRWASKLPREISLTSEIINEERQTNHIEVRRVNLLGGSYYREKKVSDEADGVAPGVIKFGERLFKGKSNCWLVRNVKGGMSREIFLPMAAFNMSKIAGLDKVTYHLTFSGYDDPKKEKQEVVFLNEKNMADYVYNSKDSLYAKMKVEGTDVWFLWFLRA